MQSPGIFKLGGCQHHYHGERVKQGTNLLKIQCRGRNPKISVTFRPALSTVKEDFCKDMPKLSFGC